MYLTRLIYFSKIVPNTTEGDIKKIVETARLKNKKRDITGALFSDNGYFFQCLEGARSEVNSIYINIVHSDKHSDCTLISFTDISKRIFPEWDMGYMPMDNLSAAGCFKYCTHREFRPDSLSPSSAEGLLSEIAENKYII